MSGKNWTERGGGAVGQTLPLVVIFMMSLLLAAGLTIDVGNAYRVKQSLQASADAASAAGAGNLPSPGAAVAAANSFGSEPGGKNPIPGSGPVSLQATTNCATGPKFCNPANTVQVTESANVPTYFLHLVGIDHVTVTVHSQACSPCGALPLDIVMVLDRTGSMAGQKLVNAKQGVTSFLDDLDPAIDNVGLVVLPPAASTRREVRQRADLELQPDERGVPGGAAEQRLRHLAGEPQRLVGPHLDPELRPGGWPDGLRERPRRRPDRAQRERPARSRRR